MKINMKKEQTLAVDVSRVHKPTHTHTKHTHTTHNSTFLIVKESKQKRRDSTRISAPGFLTNVTN